jgi:hypothetical protein
MALDADNHSRGFAFVEFEEEVGSLLDVSCSCSTANSLFSTERRG